MKPIKECFGDKLEDLNKFISLLSKTKLSIFFNKKLNFETKDPYELEVIDEICDLCEINNVSFLPNVGLDKIKELNFIQLYIFFVGKKIHEILILDYFKEIVLNQYDNEIIQAIVNLSLLIKSQVENILNSNLFLEQQQEEEKEFDGIYVDISKAFYIDIDNWSVLDAIFLFSKEKQYGLTDLGDILEERDQSDFVKGIGVKVNFKKSDLLKIDKINPLLLEGLEFDWDFFCKSFAKVYLGIKQESFDNDENSDKYYKFVNNVLYQIAIGKIGELYELEDYLQKNIVEFEKQQQINNYYIANYIGGLYNKQQEGFEELMFLITGIPIENFSTSHGNKVEINGNIFEFSGLMRNIGTKIFGFKPYGSNLSEEEEHLIIGKNLRKVILFFKLLKLESEEQNKLSINSFGELIESFEKFKIDQNSLSNYLTGLKKSKNGFRVFKEVIDSIDDNVFVCNTNQIIINEQLITLHNFLKFIGTALLGAKRQLDIDHKIQVIKNILLLIKKGRINSFSDMEAIFNS